MSQWKEITGIRSQRDLKNGERAGVSRRVRPVAVSAGQTIGGVTGREPRERSYTARDSDLDPHWIPIFGVPGSGSGSMSYDLASTLKIKIQKMFFFCLFGENINSLSYSYTIML